MLYILLFLQILTISTINSSPLERTCIDLSGHIFVCPTNESSLSQNTSQLVASVAYANRINQTGWAQLELTSNGVFADNVQAYYSGYLEGYVTAKLIKSFRFNILQENKKFWCSNVSDFISANLNYTVRMIGEHETDSYWQQVGLSLYQIAGLDDGFALAETGKSGKVKPHLEIDSCGTILLNLMPELPDIKSILNQTLTEPKRTHCSAIIKLLPNDLLVAHNTWVTYRSMLRIMKKYTLNFASSAAKSVSMSSYPGAIYSIDDFYITSRNLVVLETSLVNFNDSLWRDINASGIVFEFVRNVVANRMARNGAEWVKYFSLQNSGTYNNQFMIVDYKQFGENGTNTNGLLTVVEQMPGLIVHADKTDHLLKFGYWASYNKPYFQQIYTISEHDRMFEKYGDYYSYNQTARARIFARDQPKVTNLTTLYQLMRYNDMFNDSLSQCNCTPPYSGEYAIAARSDLNDPKGQYPIDDLAFRVEGATDAKITNALLATNLEMIAVSGPTDQNVPTFSWNDPKVRDEPHLDQPVEWKFQPIVTKWNGDSEFPFYEFDL